MAELIALFPLSHVLLPGMPLPLHIFEQRYRDLLADVVADPTPGVHAATSGATARRSFGVVALRSGSEALTPALNGATAPDVELIGTLAEIVEIETNADGTSDVLAVGSRRFRVASLVTSGTAYLRAEVDWLDEPDGALRPAAQIRARELIEVYDEVLRRLTGRSTGGELPDDANQLSYQVAARLPLGPSERQDLLADPTTAERLARLARLLRRELALLRGTRSIAVSPGVLRMGTGVN